MNPSPSNSDDQAGSDQRPAQTAGTSPAEELAPGQGPPAAPSAEAQPATLDAVRQEAEARVLRAQAELENFRKRMRREMEDERRYASLPLMRDLLSVLDNLHRALGVAGPASPESGGLVDGVRMVAQELRGVLEKHHCRQIPAQGQPFDPNFHAAIGQVPDSDDPPGTVVQVAVEGFQLHDRVVRPAQVFVSVPPPDPSA